MLGFKRIFSVLVTLALVFGFITEGAFAADDSDKVNSIMKNGQLAKDKAKLISSEGTEYLVNIYKTKKN